MNKTLQYKCNLYNLTHWGSFIFFKLNLSPRNWKMLALSLVVTWPGWGIQPRYEVTPLPWRQILRGVMSIRCVMLLFCLLRGCDVASVITEPSDFLEVWRIYFILNDIAFCYVDSCDMTVERYKMITWTIFKVITQSFENQFIV